MPIQNINMTAIKSLGFSSITLKLEIIKKIVEAVILIISFLINVYAVAWGIVLYNFICIFINLSPSKRLVDYSYLEQIRDIIPTLIASLIMGCSVFFCSFLPLNILVVLSIQICIGILVYYLACRLLQVEGLVYISKYVKKGLHRLKHKKS